MILSSQVLSRPRCCRMDLTCSKASRSLQRGREESDGGVSGGEMTAATDEFSSPTGSNHLSICERNFVSKMPLVLSVSEICPLNRNPLLVISMSILRTISPRYIPLHIFSYLQDKSERNKETTDTLWYGFKSRRPGSSGGFSTL